jgi:hypothetical protein
MIFEMIFERQKRSEAFRNARAHPAWWSKELLQRPTFANGWSYGNNGQCLPELYKRIMVISSQDISNG